MASTGSVSTAEFVVSGYSSRGVDFWRAVIVHGAEMGIVAGITAGQFSVRGRGDKLIELATWADQHFTGNWAEQMRCGVADAMARATPRIEHTGPEM